MPSVNGIPMIFRNKNRLDELRDQMQERLNAADFSPSDPNAAMPPSPSPRNNDEASFVLQQPYDSMSDEQGKDEEEYIEKVKETACPVSLKDDKHRDILLKRLDTLRRNREFCDVVLYAGQREIFAHKVVLASLSPAFYDLLASPAHNNVGGGVGGGHSPVISGGGHLSPEGSTLKSNVVNGRASPRSQATTVTTNTNTTSTEACQTFTSSMVNERLSFYEFADIDYESLEAIVNFAYTGCLEIHSDRVAQLYKAAYSLRINTCVKACAVYLSKMLSVKNCIGLRKCANKNNDSLLGSQIDSFIQKDFNEIICNSNEFTSLPCIQIDVFLSADDRVKFKDEWKLGEKIIDWLQQQSNDLPEHVEFRMENFTEKSYMLYLDSDMNFQDCNDVDDNSSVGSCDLVQDYKKQSRKFVANPKKSLTNGLLGSGGQASRMMTIGGGGGQQTSSLASGQSKLHGLTNGEKVSPISGGPSSYVGHVTNLQNGSSGLNGSLNGHQSSKKLLKIASTESMSSLASDVEEFEWKIVAISKSSDNYYVMLAIIKRKLAVVSIRANDAPFLKARPGLNDWLSLLMKTQQDTIDSVPLANMLNQRCNVGAVFLDGALIVCGGNNRGECLRTVEKFDFAANRWTNLAPMLKERGRFDACVCLGKIFVAGGSDGTRDLNTCESYDPRTDEWSRRPDFPLPRTSNSVDSVADKVYCIGGWDGQSAVRTCDVYDPPTNEWSPAAHLCTGRYQAGCCSWNNKIIVVGGFDTWSCLNSTEIYDPHTNQWRHLPPLIAPRRGCGAAVLNNKLYVAGGSDGAQTLSTSEMLDLSDPGATWRLGPLLNTARGNLRLVAAPVDNRLFAIGGFSGKTFLNTIEYLEEGTFEWRTSIPNSSKTSTPMTSSAPAPLPMTSSSAPDRIDEDVLGELTSGQSDFDDESKLSNSLLNDSSSDQSGTTSSTAI